MKATSILILFLTIALGLSANDDYKKTVNIQPKLAKKSDITPIVRIKYNLSLSKKYELKYEIVMPMKKSNLAILSWKSKQSRFETKAIYQPRFQNLEKLDLASIVERNKIYNLSKTIQVRSY
jgi:hypothetical protein